MEKKVEIRGKEGYTAAEVSRVIFRKNVVPACAYCTHSRAAEEDSYICVKRGIVSAWDSCRSFSYDPLRRVPEASPVPKTDGLDQADFDLSE